MHLDQAMIILKGQFWNYYELRAITSANRKDGSGIFSVCNFPLRQLDGLKGRNSQSCAVSLNVNSKANNSAVH